MRFVGSVYRGVNLLAKDVSGDYRPEPQGGATGWAGTILTPRGESIPPGGPYELQLSNGRRGQIVVTSVRVSNGGPTIINFCGTGPGPNDRPAPPALSSAPAPRAADRPTPLAQS